MTAESYRHSPHGAAGNAHHRHAIPYQLDHTKHSTGKHISTTKRRVSFSFGFASLPALAKRATGPAARGVEYELVLFWSLCSGKRHVYLNNRLIHSSVSPNRSVQKFAYGFSLGSNEHDVRIVAHVACPSHGRQYDLTLDGQSFFDMLRIYELGGSKCREMYRKDMEYAESLSGDELDRWEREEREALTLIAAARTAPPYASWRNGDGVADDDDYGMSNGRMIHDRRVTAPPGLGYGPPSKAAEQRRRPPHPLAPSTRMEEKAMLEAAKQRSLRDLKAPSGGGAMTTATAGGDGGSGWGRQPPQLRQPQLPQRHSMPAFTGFHEAFRPPPSQRGGLDPISEKNSDHTKGDDLIDLFSEAPSNGDRPGVGRRAASMSVLTGASFGGAGGRGGGGGGGGPDLIDLSSTTTTEASAPPLPRPSFQRDVSEVTLDPSLLRQSSVPGSVGFGRTSVADDVDDLSMASATPDPTRAFQSSGYAAQPTWDQIDAAFAHPHPPPPPQRQQQPQPQPPPATCHASHAPTDTSFAQYAAPVTPGSGASFAYAPPPTMEQMNADFGYAPAAPASQRQQQRPQHPWTVGQTSGGGGAVSAGYGW